MTGRLVRAWGRRLAARTMAATCRPARLGVIAALVLASAPGPAWAQHVLPSPGPETLWSVAPPPGEVAPAAVRLTLAEAVRRGLDASHRLAELRARAAASVAIADGRQAASRPLVALQAGYTRTSHVQEYSLPLPGAAPRVIYPDVPDNFRARVEFQWPIFTAGRLDALARAAQAEADASNDDLEAARADLKLEITRAFWALVTATEAERVVDHAVALADAHLEDVKNRQKAGLVPPSDVLATEARRSSQQVLLIEARRARASAAADLRRLLGLDPETPIELDAALDEPVNVPAAAAALVTEARGARAERQAIERRLAASSAREEAARKGRGPVVGIGGGYDYMRPNPRIFPREAAWNGFWDIGVSASFTLWDGGRTAAEIAEATAARQGLGERLREFDSLLETDVRQRLLDLEAAQAAVEAAAAAVRSAAEARRVVEMRFKAGVAINSDVLEAQQVLLQAELDHTRAKANVRLAVARLERSIGR